MEQPRDELGRFAAASAEGTKAAEETGRAHKVESDKNPGEKDSEHLARISSSHLLAIKAHELAEDSAAARADSASVQYHRKMQAYHVDRMTAASLARSTKERAEGVYQPMLRIRSEKKDSKLVKWAKSR